MGFYIFSILIPYYGFFIAMGVLVAGIVGWLLCKKFGLDWNDFLILLGIASLGGMIGAKLLYVLVSYRHIDVSKLTDFAYLSKWLRGGFVFYGGLIGAASAYVWTRKKIPMQDYSSVIATLLPLAHGFGRIGCHFVGCCHGRNSGHLHHVPYVLYQNSPFAPNFIRLFPVQLAEALGNFLFFFILLYFLFRRGEDKAGNAERYLILYSLLRFFLEFFRGDLLRGRYWLFSTSQWISLFIFFSVLMYGFWKKRKKA